MQMVLLDDDSLVEHLIVTCVVSWSIQVV